MRLVRGGSIVLERLVMRNIVALGKAVAANVGGFAIAEAALEPAPADAFCIQQIADVFAAHGNCFTRRALVKGRLRITNPATMSPAKNATTLVAPAVWPEIRLMAPGEEGPKVVLNELSFMAKCWA